MKSILLKIKNYLFPETCVLCDESLIDTQEVYYGLCDECRELISRRAGINSEKGENAASRCAKCGKPLISEIDTCLACRNDPDKSFDKLWVLYPYTGKYKELLGKYKFEKKLPLANFLREQILPILEEPELKEAVIVPVPPRPGKIKNQGWDQVNYLVNRLKRQVNKCLKRRKSKVQKELNRHGRIENLKNRIYTNGNVPKIALIIDDVITTGSTLEVCASVLKEAGAEKVYGLCLFYD